VTLRGLDINGLGTGLNGVQVLSAASVRIELSRIYGFTLNGVDFEQTNPGAGLLVQSSQIYAFGLAASPNFSTNWG
jgi:hypothetical protein